MIFSEENVHPGKQIPNLSRKQTQGLKFLFFLTYRKENSDIWI